MHTLKPKFYSYLLELFKDVVVNRLAKVDEVDLVDRNDHVWNSKQCNHREVTSGLFENTLASVDQDHDCIGRCRTGDHVAGVLNVPRAVSQDETALGSGEVAVGDINGDALLALGTKTVR